MLVYAEVSDGEEEVSILGFSRPVPRKLFNLAAGKGLVLQLANLAWGLCAWLGSLKDKSNVWWSNLPSEEILERYAALNVA